MPDRCSFCHHVFEGHVLKYRNREMCGIRAKYILQMILARKFFQIIYS